MAENQVVFWGHGASTGAAAGGGAGEEATGDPAQSSATCFVSLNILYIHVEFLYCDSRLLCVKRHLFMIHVQTQ